MKTGAWLRGGRGKIAGMVAQKSSDGKGTVLRELVIPKNPQSIDQMATRLAFGTVTQAAAIMLPIVGQSFKGQPDEKMNRRRFVALNTPILKERAKAQDADPSAVATALYRGKNYNGIIPNDYIISEGSLALPTTLQATIVESGGSLLLTTVQENLNSITLIAGQSYDPAALLARLFGVLKSQQITTLYIISKDGSDVAYSNAASASAFIRNMQFYSSRIVFKENAGTFEYTAGMTFQQLWAELVEGLNADKVSPFVIGQIEAAISLNENVLTGTGGVDIFAPSLEDDERIIACGFVVSELNNGVWDYSNSQMRFQYVNGERSVSNNEFTGLTFGDALIDYLGSEVASKLYTRKGGSINTY